MEEDSTVMKCPECWTDDNEIHQVPVAQILWCPVHRIRWILRIWKGKQEWDYIPDGVSVEIQHTEEGN